MIPNRFFQVGLIGGPDYLPGQDKRARWVVADAVRKVAKTEERSMKSRMCLMAGDIENGIRPTKRVLDKIGHKRLGRIKEVFHELTK